MVAITPLTADGVTRSHANGTDAFTRTSVPGVQVCGVGVACCAGDAACNRLRPDELNPTISMTTNRPTKIRFIGSCFRVRVLRGSTSPPSWLQAQEERIQSNLVNRRDDYDITVGRPAANIE